MGSGWWDGAYLKFDLEACETAILGLLLVRGRFLGVRGFGHSDAGGDAER